MRAGLARLSKRSYTPMPTVYDGLFPDGTYLTAPTRAPRRPAAIVLPDEPPSTSEPEQRRQP